MIRFSVFYPSAEGATFDHDYYANSHVPLAVKTWGLDGAQIDKGLDGPYVAAVHFTFESMEAMGAALGTPGTADVMADVANYTTISPVTQTSEIIASQGPR
ncbi:MAG: Ethyl tert-butyl ether degradation EthD [Acidimicrobiales bacterium]|nr:Ethyl tert-butyl ether degradation EthD [Acidimicrobiales bacterium]